MINKSRLNDFIINNLTSRHFLIDLSISSSNQIQVFIDSMEGLSIAECVSYTKLIESEFDRDIEDYELSVSSGGLDLSFTVDQQFEKNINKEVELIAKDGNKYQGILKAFSKNKVEVEVEEKELLEGKKRKQLIKKEVSFDRVTEIKSIKAVVSFKKNKK